MPGAQKIFTGSKIITQEDLDCALNTSYETYDKALGRTVEEELLEKDLLVKDGDKYIVYPEEIRQHIQTYPSVPYEYFYRKCALCEFCYRLGEYSYSTLFFLFRRATNIPINVEDALIYMLKQYSIDSSCKVTIGETTTVDLRSSYYLFLLSEFHTIDEKIIRDITTKLNRRDKKSSIILTFGRVKPKNPQTVLLARLAEQFVLEGAYIEAYGLLSMIPKNDRAKFYISLNLLRTISNKVDLPNDIQRQPQSLIVKKLIANAQWKDLYDILFKYNIGMNIHGNTRTCFKILLEEILELNLDENISYDFIALDQYEPVNGYGNNYTLAILEGPQKPDIETAYRVLLNYNEKQRANMPIFWLIEAYMKISKLNEISFDSGAIGL